MPCSPRRWRPDIAEPATVAPGWRPICALEGVADDLIDGAVAGLTATEEAAALTVAHQLWERAGAPETRDQRTRMRVAGALQRRGFAPSLVVRVMRDLA